MPHINRIGNSRSWGEILGRLEKSGKAEREKRRMKTIGTDREGPQGSFSGWTDRELGLNGCEKKTAERGEFLRG